MATEPSGIGVYSPKIKDQSVARKFVSQNGYGYIALNIRKPDGTSVDADPGTLRVQLYYLDPTLEVQPTNDPLGTLVLDTTDGINRVDTGMYDMPIGPQFTGQRGVLTAQWTYQVNGTLLTFLDHLQVLNQMPIYDTLDDAHKLVVEQVNWMFGDLYDSAEGGPHLMDEFQTHFDSERISQLMGIATTRMSVTGFPVMDWDLTNPPPSNFAGLEVIGTYLEVIRHLRDSYTEIPARPNMNVTYTDRTAYSQRWAQILAQEYPEWVKMVKMAKRKLLGMGRGSLLVAGGIYGGGARGLFVSGTYASAVRAWRFYPAAPAISWGSQWPR